MQDRLCPHSPLRGRWPCRGIQLILAVRGRGQSAPTGTADRSCGAVTGTGSALAPRRCLVLEGCCCPGTWLRMFFPSSLLLSAAPAFAPSGLTAPTPRRGESNCSSQRSPKPVALHSSSAGSCRDAPLPHPGSSPCLSSSGCGGFAPQLPISSLAAAQVNPRAGWKRLCPPSLLRGPSAPAQPPLPCSLPAPPWATSGSALAAGAPFLAQCWQSRGPLSTTVSSGSGWPGLAQRKLQPVGTSSWHGRGRLGSQLCCQRQTEASHRALVQAALQLAELFPQPRKLS